MCLACQRSESDAAIPDDRAEGEELLSAVLRSTRGDRPATDDDVTASDTAVRSGTLPDDGRRPPDSSTSRSEQIVLRELDPARSAAAAADDTSHTRSSVAASLLEALTDTIQRTESTASAATPSRGRVMSAADAADVIDITNAVPVLDTPPQGPKPDVPDRPTETLRGDTEQDAEPDTTDHTDTEPDTSDHTDTEPDTEPDTSDHTDTAPDTEPDTSDHTDTAPDTEPDTSDHTDTAQDAAEQTEPADTTEPIDDPDAPASEASEASDAAVPVDASEPPEATHASPAPVPRDDSATDDPSTADHASGAQPPAGAPKAGPASSADGAEETSSTEPESLRSRLRTTFREVGAWTAVAQLALLVTGLLCVFQVVVLLVVLRFLLQASTQDTATAAAMLVAHGRAINVMLPALVAAALVVAALAIWHVRRATDRETHSARLLDVPVSLWAMIAAASAVGGLVVVDASSTVEQAAQTTLFAITACALLGATAFIAPRGIAAAASRDEPKTSSDHAAPEHDARSGSGGEVTAPDDDPAPRSDQATTPSDQATTPDDQATTPDDQATTPDDQATTPSDQATAPSDQATAPDDQAITPDDQATASDDQATAPEDDGGSTSRRDQPADVSDVSVV